MPVNYTCINLGYFPPRYGGLEFAPRHVSEAIPVMAGARDSLGNDKLAFELPPNDLKGIEILMHLAREHSNWAIMPAVISGKTVKTNLETIPTVIQRSLERMGEAAIYQVKRSCSALLLMSHLRKNGQWIEGLSGVELRRYDTNLLDTLDIPLPPEKTMLVSLYDGFYNERSSDQIAKTMAKLARRNFS